MPGEVISTSRFTGPCNRLVWNRAFDLFHPASIRLQNRAFRVEVVQELGSELFGFRRHGFRRSCTDRSITSNKAPVGQTLHEIV